MDKLSAFFAVIVLASGFFVSLKISFFQFGHLGKALKTALSVGGRRQSKTAPGITPFQALATALGGSIGTANIAGVAGAAALGGAGAVFWMWTAALAGMGVKYAEIVLALKYRVRNGNSWQGGAMLYIEKGLGKKGGFPGFISKPLAFVFALFGIAASLIGTTLVQSNTIAMSVLDCARTFSPSVNPLAVRLVSGIAAAILVGTVILGGLKRIGKASEIIVPFMALAYAACCFIVIFKFKAEIPRAFAEIFTGAFGLKQFGGGIAGYGFLRAFRVGTARGVYSNEAGVGSAPMAHACASTNDPVRQGMYGIFEVFADTLMCTLTAAAVLASGAVSAGVSGTGIALRAFSAIMPEKAAGVLLSGAMLLFAYTSLLGWSVYGTQCARYIFGEKSIMPFRILYVLFSVCGAMLNVNAVWRMGETFNYLMAIPNLTAVLLLSGEVAKETNEFRRFDN